MRVSLTSLLLMFGLIGSTWAQSDEQCSADALHYAEMEQSEPYARNFQAVRDAVQRLQASSNRNMETYTIPVVVHVIHRGSPVGVDENISDAQVFSAIVGMNNDFRKKEGTTGDGNGVDTFIQFELAKRTPEGDPTNGIVRVNGNVVPGYAEHGISNGVDPDAADQSAVKALTTWYGDDYVNIFIVPEINGNDGGFGVQGFAYLGPTGDERDGLVVLYNAFGTVGELKPGRELNKTVTHEMGHHLSLWHTFANTDSCTSESDCATQGDEVCDTPSTLANQYGCDAPECEGAQVENYMDYTVETCKNMFSEGQRTRMRGSLESVRASLLESLGALPVTERDLTVTGFSNVGTTTCLPSIAPVAVVSNFGVETVSGFELTTSINGQASFTTIHGEDVASGESVEIMLPELALRPDSNTLDISVRLLGNVEDDFAGNDDYSQSFDLEANDFWTFTLNTDNWANEISWRIEGDNGEVLMEGGDYAIGSNTYTSQGCIPLGCHTLVMEDSNGDGLCSIDFGDDGVCEVGGSMSLSDAAGNVLLELDNTTNNYGSLGTWEICASESASMEGCDDANNNGVCDDMEISGCQNVNACNFTEGAIYDDGSCTFAETHYNCDGTCTNDADGDGVCDELETDGCTDSAACNYVESASNNDGSCEYTTCAGCTDPNGCNYDATATISSGCDFAEPHYDCSGACLADADGDGICDPLEVAGCTNSLACNFDPFATDDDGSCDVAATHYDCDGQCLADSDGDGVCDPLEIAGCQDTTACDYNADATDEAECTYAEPFYNCDATCVNDLDGDGVCDELEIAGCDDATACNFDVAVTDNDGSCDYPAEFYNCEGCMNDLDGDGVCDELEVAGCTDQGANNFDPAATDADDSCTYDTFGCMDATACNFNAFATEDTGNCTYPADHYDCNGACLNDQDGDGVCDELEVAGCDDLNACNFDASATDNDGSCTYAEPSYDCDGNCLNDADGDGVCDDMEVGGCDDAEACNFDVTATDNDGSCTYAEMYYDCDGNCVNDLDGDGICDEVDDNVETDNVGEFDETPALNLFPNPMSPEHSMVYLSGLDNEHTVIRVLASDGRVAWQGSGIVKSPGVVGFPIRESISPGTYFIQVGSSSPSGNIPLMVW